ncbi:MAG: hypothetical protein H6739_20760 [Alphaproteobacteria bacterium]|nr:hypothetical protein [Alphaproteobacteria bacterium]
MTIPLNMGTDGCCKFGVRETSTFFLSTEELEQDEIAPTGVEGTLPLEVCVSVCDEYIGIDTELCCYHSADHSGAEITCVYERYC